MIPNQDTKGVPGRSNSIVTALTHILVFAPVICIIALYVQNYSFFSWHPICMSLGVGFVMIEGIFCISGESNLTSRLPRANRVTLHWILNSIGLILMFIGLVIIVVNKNRLSKPHFSTTHGQLGLASSIIACIVALFGVAANNTRWLYPKVRPILIKVGHAFGGIVMTILFIATIINGAYKMKFAGSYTAQCVVFTCFSFVALLVLFKPLLGAISRTRVILKPKHSSQNQNA